MEVLLKRRLSGTNLSLENNLLMFQLNAPVIIRVKVVTGAFSQSIGKLFSKLKLVPDNLLFIYAEPIVVKNKSLSQWQPIFTV